MDTDMYIYILPNEFYDGSIHLFDMWRFIIYIFALLIFKMHDVFCAL